MSEDNYFRLGTTQDGPGGEQRQPKIGEEFNYHGTLFTLVAYEPTDKTVRCTDLEGVTTIKPMFYMVLDPKERSE